jgi:hypothetical protein
MAYYILIDIHRSHCVYNNCTRKEKFINACIMFIFLSLLDVKVLMSICTCKDAISCGKNGAEEY